MFQMVRAMVEGSVHVGSSYLSMAVMRVGSSSWCLVLEVEDLLHGCMYIFVGVG